MRDWMKHARRAKRLSGEKAAAMLEMSVPYYRLIENNQRMPKMTIEMAKKLSDVFDMPLEEIIEWETL